MSADIEGLVETSNNIARVIVKAGQIKIGCLTRSSVESSKWDMANTLVSTFELIGCEVSCDGDYPGWTPNMDSHFKSIKETYTNLNGQPPHVAACHAGLNVVSLERITQKCGYDKFWSLLLKEHILQMNVLV